MDQAPALSGIKPEYCFVDKGYCGHRVEDVEVYISGQKRGVNTKGHKRQLRRRSAIEPTIGHMKIDGLPGRNYLKGVISDAQHALLCATDHKLRLILAKIRIFRLYILCEFVRRIVRIRLGWSGWTTYMPLNATGNDIFQSRLSRVI